MPKYSTLLQKNLRAKTGEKVVRGHTLRFKNVFRSSGRKPQQYPQVGNVINFFSGEESPNGPVTSVERREKALKDARASQRANAGILTDKELRAKQLLKIKKKQEEAKQLAAERGIMMKILRTTYNDGRNPYYIEKWDKNKEGTYKQVDEAKGLEHPTDKTPIEDMWRLISKYISKDDQIKRNYVKKEAERVVQKLEEQNQEFDPYAYRALEFNPELPNEQVNVPAFDPNSVSIDPITLQPHIDDNPFARPIVGDPFAPHDDPFAAPVDPFAPTHNPLQRSSVGDSSAAPADPFSSVDTFTVEAEPDKKPATSTPTPQISPQEANYASRELEINKKALKKLEKERKKFKKGLDDKGPGYTYTNKEAKQLKNYDDKIGDLRKVIANQQEVAFLNDLKNESSVDLYYLLKQTEDELQKEEKKPREERDQDNWETLKIKLHALQQLVNRKNDEKTSAKGVIGGHLIPKITPNRVKRLFEMKSPLTIQPRVEAATEEVENDLNELKQRQRLYSERMKTLRGKAPPKGMVERAFPSGVTPLELEPNRDITPYAFLPPKKAPRLHLFYI